MCSNLMKFQNVTSPDVEDTNEVNEVTAPVSTTDDGGLILFRGSIMTCVLWVFLYHKSKCISKLL
jgi:hypothetical protein